MMESSVTIFGRQLRGDEAIKMAAWAAVWAGNQGKAQERWDTVLAMYKPQRWPLTDADVRAMMQGER